MTTYYTLEACENLISRYYENGGECLEIEPGTLGLGLTICHGDGLKTAIIREIPLNCWSSAHTIRMYNSTPKKYAAMIDEWWARSDEDAA